MNIPSSYSCQPKQEQPQCSGCARHSEDRTVIDGRKRGQVIDATVLQWPDGVCPLRIALHRSDKRLCLSHQA